MVIHVSGRQHAPLSRQAWQQLLLKSHQDLFSPRKKPHHLAVLSADVTPDAGRSPPLPQGTLQRYLCSEKASLCDGLSSCESKSTGSFMLVLAARDVSQHLCLDTLTPLFLLGSLPTPRTISATSLSSSTSTYVMAKEMTPSLLPRPPHNRC